ncbi:MAG: gliding motility-associated C-terminal domain-containing protein [Bacteroidales bacterium]|nr:gliding motility-associated C-terminal domain-containing protein [Bacteroidales bacterium]
MRKFVIYIGILLGCIGFCSAQQQWVRFTETAVDMFGNVGVGWAYNNIQQIVSVGNVLERKNATTGQYDTVFAAQNSSQMTWHIVDSNANALNDSVKYRLSTTVITATDTYYIVDSAITILPSVYNVQNQSQYAYINWNAPYLTGVTYEVFRKMPNSIWTQIGTTQQTNYQDTIRSSICNDTIYYKIRVLHTYPNINLIMHSSSAPSGAWFTDPYPTTPCTLDVVTVDTATQNIILSWQASPDPDIMGYFICQGSPCMALDTVWGQYNTTYTCTTRSRDSINAFRLYAFDSCFSASALTDPYNNVVLQMQSQHCSREIAFSWNEYINMPGGVGQYTLFLKYDNAPYRAVATEPSSSRSLSYTIPAGVRQVKAYLQISSNGNTRRALSNIKTFDMMTVDTADFIYTLGVSVSENCDALQLRFLTDTHFAATGYNIYRRSDVGSFQMIRTIPPSTNPTLDVVDNDVDLSAHRYTYYISVWDECELIEKMSNRARQIYATISSNEGTNTISWNPYDGAGNLVSYNLLRKTEGEPSWTPVATTQSCTLEDNTTQYGRVWYRVEAEYINPQSGHRCFALSQIVEYHGEPTVWVPNIFTPGRDNNNRFLPKTMFVKDHEYTMRIYNRFGLLVFETNDINEAWDGRYKGKIVPSASYVYIIQYLGDDNYSNIIKGTVTVLK